MVEPPVLVRVLNREHVGNLFHDADGRVVAFGVRADGTNLLVGEVVALRAILHVVAEAVDAAGHVVDRFGLHAQQVDGQPQRRAAPHSGQLRQLADDILKKS